MFIYIFYVLCGNRRIANGSETLFHIYASFLQQCIFPLYGFHPVHGANSLTSGFDLFPISSTKTFCMGVPYTCEFLCIIIQVVQCNGKNGGFYIMLFATVYILFRAHLYSFHRISLYVRRHLIALKNIIKKHTELSLESADMLIRMISTFIRS